MTVKYSILKLVYLNPNFTSLNVLVVYYYLLKYKNNLKDMLEEHFVIKKLEMEDTSAT